MIETLYKTPTPEDGKSECHVLVLTSRAASSGKVYLFMEEHGHWNEDAQRFIREVRAINTDEQLTFEQARRLYEMAKRKLAANGFVYSFATDGGRKQPIADPVSEPELAFA